MEGGSTAAGLGWTAAGGGGGGAGAAQAPSSKQAASSRGRAISARAHSIPSIATPGRGGQQQGPIRPRPGQRIEGAGAPMPRESEAQGPAASGGDGVAGRWRVAWGFFLPYRVFL